VPVEVVGRPSRGEGRDPGAWAGRGCEAVGKGCRGPEEGPAMPILRLRKDIERSEWAVRAVREDRR